MNIWIWECFVILTTSAQVSDAAHGPHTEIKIPALQTRSKQHYLTVSYRHN